MSPRAVQRRLSTAPKNNKQRTRCLLSSKDGSRCDKDTSNSSQPLRSMMEHIRRAHQQHYRAGLSATAENIQMMFDSVQALVPRSKLQRSPKHHSEATLAAWSLLPPPPAAIAHRYPPATARKDGEYSPRMLAASRKIRDHRISELPMWNAQRNKRLNAKILKPHGAALRQVSGRMPWAEYEFTTAKGSMPLMKREVRGLLSSVMDESERNEKSHPSFPYLDDPDATDEEELQPFPEQESFRGATLAAATVVADRSHAVEGWSGQLFVNPEVAKQIIEPLPLNDGYLAAGERKWNGERLGQPTGKMMESSAGTASLIAESAMTPATMPVKIVSELGSETLVTEHGKDKNRIVAQKMVNTELGHHMSY